MDEGHVRSVFDRKGLAAPACADLGPWRLRLFPKKLDREPRMLRAPDGRCVFCVGTMTYRSLGADASLRRWQEDLVAGVEDAGEFAGNFCAGAWDGKVLTLRTDGLRVQRLFHNEAGTCISTSFLAVVASSTGPLRLRRTALHENLATGFVVGPDTLVEEIHEVTGDPAPALERRADLRVVAGTAPRGDGPRHAGGVAASLQATLAELKAYVARIATLASESGVELGLSSGFDSRLLLSLSGGFAAPIPLHSHLTRGVHESELAIARRLAAIGGNPLEVVPTTRLEDLPEDRRRAVLRDNLYFFDGRCIHDMGHGSETYTADYRIRVLGGHRLSLHGLGGEILRNVYTMPDRRFAWSAWEDYAFMFPFAREACETGEAFAAMRGRLAAKIAARLGTDLAEPVDPHLVRRYYGLVRMPVCAGNVCNAYNQVAMVVAPFVEPSTLAESLRATSYMGTGGAYEAALIAGLAPRLAAVESQYGYTFASIPLRQRLRERLVAALPLAVRTERRRRHVAAAAQRQTRSGGADAPCMRELADVLRTLFPAADWTMALADECQRRTAFFVASFLSEFSGKLKT